MVYENLEVFTLMSECMASKACSLKYPNPAIYYIIFISNFYKLPKLVDSSEEFT